jgi:hypothetical protein
VCSVPSWLLTSELRVPRDHRVNPVQARAAPALRGPDQVLEARNKGSLDPVRTASPLVSRAVRTPAIGKADPLTGQAVDPLTDSRALPKNRAAAAVRVVAAAAQVKVDPARRVRRAVPPDRPRSKRIQHFRHDYRAWRHAAAPYSLFLPRGKFTLGLLQTRFAEAALILWATCWLRRIHTFRWLCPT